jgi:hypothetical protein
MWPQRRCQYRPLRTPHRHRRRASDPHLRGVTKMKMIPMMKKKNSTDNTTAKTTKATTITQQHHSQPTVLDDSSAAEHLILSVSTTVSQKTEKS